MTTYTLNGFTTVYDINDNVIAVNATTLDIQVTAQSNGTLTYTIVGGDPGDLPEADIVVDGFIDARLDGAVIPDEVLTEVGEVTWGGGTSQILAFWSNPPVNAPSQDWYFALGGAVLPDIAGAADPLAAWNAFEQSVTGVGAITSGPFAPATPITIATLPNTTVTQSNVIDGTPGDDVLDGTPGDDTINGFDGNDELNGGAGNDILNPGDNTSFDDIRPGTGNDTVDFSDLSVGYAGLLHDDLGAGITVTINGNANTGVIDKGVNGTTTLINVENPILAGANIGGLGVFGTNFDDAFNVSSADGGWMQLRGGDGVDSYTLGASSGSLRLDFRGAAEDVIVNLETGLVADDGFGNAEVISGAGRVTELRSGMFDDTITGSALDDRFILMAGNDTVDGGAGFDLLRYDRSGVDGVTVDLNAGTATGIWRGEAFTHTISNIEYLRGSVGNDDLTASDLFDSRIEGRDGDDIIDGGAANDTLIGGNGNDDIDGGKGDDVIEGNAGNDTLLGENGDDIIDGGAGNDTILGENGDDRLNGGDGKDTLKGGNGTDQLFGGDGNDILNPGDNTDFDYVQAGAGNDRIVLSQVSTGFVSIGHFDLDARIVAKIDGTANTGVILKDGGNGSTKLVKVANPLTADGLEVVGTEFNDVFQVTPGDGGWMQLRGLQGNDIFNVTAASTGTIRLDYRDDTVSNGITANLDTGIIADDGFGGRDKIIGVGRITELRATMLDDTITGSDEADRFILMAGNDTVDGGAGYDVVRYDRSGVEAVTVDLEAGTASGVWNGVAFTHSLTSIEEVRGSRDGDDILTASAAGSALFGRGGDDMLFGADGDDSLLGEDGDDTITLVGSGADYVDGGDGNDTLIVDTAGLPNNFDVLVDFNTGSQDVVGGSPNGDTFVNIENYTFVGPQDVEVIGDAQDNILTTGDGDDTLNGGLGDDTLIGGGGNDMLIGDKGFDLLKGGAGDDMLEGGAAFDVLNGGLGADALDGGAGVDTASYADATSAVRADLKTASSNTGEAAGDTYRSIENRGGSDIYDLIIGNNLANTLEGGAGNDRVDGRKGDDVVIGGAGNDTVIGSFGDDSLTGGTGRDTFVFNRGVDVITDFGGADGSDQDRLRLDDRLWGNANLSNAQVLDFAEVVGGDTVFDFGGGNTLTLENYTDISGLDPVLTIF